MKKGILLGLMLLLGAGVHSQSVVLDGNPASVRWKQVKTPSFHVIFPEGYETQAQKIANTLEYIKVAESETLSPTLPRRIPVVLNMYQSVSNGLVGMGPWRSEFDLMPSPRPDLQGTNEWDELLSTHEYRHMVQFHHSRQGFNKFVNFVFGQQALAGMGFAAVPRWFWEGDATLIETLHTESGRGRIPAFGRVYRTNFLEGKRFNYHKQHLGSYKDFVPDHYRMGYYFVSHIRKRTGNPNIWEDVTRDAWRKSIIPFTFSNALKKHTGIHLVENYELMMDDLQEVFSDQISKAVYSDPEDIFIRKETTYTDYMYPQELNDGSILAVKSGIGDFNQFVRFTQGREELVKIPGIFSDVGMLSVRNNKLLYSEILFDPRWRNRTYSVLKILDLNTKKIKTITSKSRFQGGDLAPDGSKLVTAESEPGMRNRLVVLNTNGARLNNLPNPDNGFYSSPRWSDDGRLIIAIKQHKASKRIVAFDYLNNRELDLLDVGNENISNAVMVDSVIYFNSPFNGIDNIYAYNLVNQRRYRITSSRYGAYNPEISADGQWLYYNEHRLNGMDVVRLPLQYSWEEMAVVPYQRVDYFKSLLEQESGKVPDSLEQEDFPVSRYSKAGHMFNVHSWGPLATTDQNTIDVGVISRDVIATTQLSAGYRYDLSENEGQVYGQISYQGLYPIIDVGVEYGNRNSFRGTLDRERDINFDWKELGVFAGIRLPFLLTRSKMLSEFIISNQVGATRVTDFSNSQELPMIIDPEFSERSVPRLDFPGDTIAFYFSDELSTGTLLSNNLSLTYYRLLKRSPRDINSQYGFIINGRWLSTPFGGDFTAETIAARLTLYAPSPFQLTGSPVFKHHSLWFTGAWQQAQSDYTSDLYSFRNQIPRPRGYSYPLYYDFLYAGVNYTLPLWYPDLALGPVLYIKRFRANAFFDYGEGTRQRLFYDFKNDTRLIIPEITETYESVGVELTADMHIMRFPQEFGLGVRYSRLLTTNGNSFDFLLSIPF